MADRNFKIKQNISGKYYVDTTCIYCGQCHILAPNFFVDDIKANCIYVIKQPLTKEDVDLCERALTICPVNAIGNDGE